MEDNSSASSDSDNALLGVNTYSKMNRNSVSTQTPEMPRHEILPVDSRRSSGEDPRSIVVDPRSIVVYKIDTQKPISDLEQEARSLAIPEVVVEYIKDNLKDKEGVTNPAFEPEELIVVRTASSVSLRDLGNDAHPNTLLPTGLANSKMYRSLPRTFRKGSGDPRLHSQPSSPQFGRQLQVVGPSTSASTSSLVAPPSPNFGYRPLESETSAVYTIIAPVKYVAKQSDGEIELRLLAQIAELKREKACTRKFEFSPEPPEVQKKRRRLQFVTDSCSLMCLIPGILLAIFTPITIIPMFILPMSYYIAFICLFIFSGIASAFIIALSGLTGNLVWYYDPEKKKVRARFHCGKGPLRHFWGNIFFSSSRRVPQIFQNGEKIV